MGFDIKPNSSGVTSKYMHLILGGKEIPETSVVPTTEVYGDTVSSSAPGQRVPVTWRGGDRKLQLLWIENGHAVICGQKLRMKDEGGGQFIIQFHTRSECLIV